MCSTSSRGLLLNSLRISSMKDLSIALSSLKSDAIMKKAKRTPMSSLSPMKVSNATSQVYYHGCVSFSIFLDAPSLLYKKSCPSVGPSVGPSVRPVLFSKVKSTHTGRILCRVSGLVSSFSPSSFSFLYSLFSFFSYGLG